MRDDSILERESVAAEATTEWRGRTATVAGALISLVVLTVVVVWSYRLGVRDAAEIPVIRAEIEATKSRPGEPGGLIVDHQDRVVYTVLGNEQTGGEVTLATPAEGLAAEDVAPSVAPDPAPRPVPNAENDVVIASPAPVAEPPVRPTANVPSEPASDVVTPVPEAPAPVADATEDAAEPEASAEAIPETSPEAEAEAVATLAPRSAPRAAPRPVRSSRAPAAAPKEDTSAEAEPRAAALASRIQIQLGAFDSEAIAASEWVKIKGRNGSLLSGRGRVITTVLSGGRKLYRLRAGPFDTVAQASALCRSLQARNEACIVARAQ